MAKYDFWLKVLRIMPPDPYKLCIYGQKYPYFMAYFKEIANTYYTRPQIEITQLLNKNGDFKI